MTHPPIVYIITKLELGGAQKICLALFKEQLRQGNTAFLITGDQGALIEEVKNLPNTYLLPSFKRELTITTVVHEFKTITTLIKIVRTLHAQYPNLIVHTHSSKAGIVGRIAAWWAKIPYRIHTIHGFSFNKHQPLFLRWAAYILELICAPITTHFICVSQKDRAYGSRLFFNFSRKSSLIRAAVAPEHFTLPPAPTLTTTVPITPFIFGTISCLKPQKNVLDLLRAFALLYTHNQNTRLEIIGDGILRSELESWVREHNLEQVIIFHGWRHDIPELLRTWHCFVLSSLWEGLPCSLIEARLAQLPLLCYDTDGVSEICINTSNGFLYPQKSWPALSQGMRELVENKELYLKLRSYPDNIADFTYTAMFEQHQKLYSSFSI